MSDTDGGGEQVTTALLAFSVANLVLTFLHLGVGLHFLVKRRNAWPFVGRNVALVVACVVPLVVTQALSLARTALDRTGPCTLILASYLALMTFLPACFLRAYRVYFLYMAACEKVVGAQAYAKPKLWYTFRAHWVSTRNLMLVLLGWVLVIYVPGFSVYAWSARDPSFPTSSPDCDLQRPLYFLIGTLFIFTIGGAILLWKMRHVDDGFYIRLELRFVIIASVVFGAIQGLVGDNLWIATIFSSLGANTILFLTLTLMAILSFGDERRSNRDIQKRRKSARKKRGSLKAGRLSRADSKTGSRTISATHSIDGLSLSQVLDEPDLTTMFVDHLKREFAVEYILLYQAARRFRERCTLSDANERDIEAATGSQSVVKRSARGFSSNAQRNLRAAAIYRDFIAPHSRLEVPLPHMTVESIQSELIECISDFNVKQSSAPEPPSDSSHATLMVDIAIREKSMSIPENVEFPRAVSETVFEAAEEYVFKLMEKDSFSRFKQRFPKLLVNGNGETTSEKTHAPSPV